MKRVCIRYILWIYILLYTYRLQIYIYISMYFLFCKISIAKQSKDGVIQYIIIIYFTPVESLKRQIRFVSIVVHWQSKVSTRKLSSIVYFAIPLDDLRSHQSKEWIADKSDPILKYSIVQCLSMVYARCRIK